MVIAEFFQKSGRIFEAEPEQTILTAGTSSSVHLVLSGQVLLHSASVIGRELVFDVVAAGHLFGMTSMVETVPHYNAVAWTKCRLAVVEAALLERAMMEQPALAIAILKQSVRLLVRRRAQIEDFALLNFPNRLAKWFVRLAEDQGVDMSRGTSFQCEFSQTLIARMVGASRETVSRQIQRWEDSGILAHSGKTISIHDSAFLQKIAEGFPVTEPTSKA